MTDSPYDCLEKDAFEAMHICAGSLSPDNVEEMRSTMSAVALRCQDFLTKPENGDASVRTKALLLGIATAAGATAYQFVVQHYRHGETRQSSGRVADMADGAVQFVIAGGTA